MTALEQAKAKLPLPELMAHLGFGDHARKSSKCMFHDDRSPSFGIYQSTTGEWRWKCHAGCGSGDGADFIEKLENLAPPDACRRYIELAGTAGAASQPLRACSAPAVPTRPMAAPHAVDIYRPTDEECAAAIRMIEALRSDYSLCERVAKSRGWKPETIQNVAAEGYLGWHEGKLAFIYDCGAKLRWRESGERIIRWAFGKPWLWRGAFIHAARTVYICEGETDNLALLDGRVEETPGVVAVAMPSASTFDARWAPMFAGKDVILALDGDAAGIQATQRLSKLLRGHARSLNRLNWEGVAEHAAQG